MQKLIQYKLLKLENNSYTLIDTDIKTKKDIPKFLRKVKFEYALLEITSGTDSTGKVQFFAKIVRQSIDADFRKVLMNVITDINTDPDPNTKGFKERIGFNFFGWDGLPKYSKNRMFVPMTSIFSDSGLLTVTQTNSGNYNLDDLLLKANGSVFLCLSWALMSLRNNKSDGYGGADKDFIWKNPGTTGLKPEDYSIAAEAVWQIVARYGFKTHPTSKLKVNSTPAWNNAPFTAPLSGLGLLKEIEIENETNRWWKDELSSYTPQQFAAFMVAMYKAVKDADPSMKVIMPGLAFFDEQYMLAAKKWWIDNGYKSYPFDIINYHHYNNKGNKELRVELTEAISPLEDNFEVRCNRVIGFTKKEFGNYPIYLSEIGYDSSVNGPVPYSVQSAPNAKLAMQWNAEATRIALQCGFDAVQLYKFKDLGDMGTYQASGMYTSKGELKEDSFIKYYEKL